MFGRVETMFLTGALILGTFFVHASTTETPIVEGTANSTKNPDIELTSTLKPTEGRFIASDTARVKSGKTNNFKILEENTTDAKIHQLPAADFVPEKLRLPNILTPPIEQPPSTYYQRKSDQAVHQTDVRNAPSLHSDKPAANKAEPSFYVLDVHPPNKSADHISPEKILNGPIIIAIPLESQTLAIFYVDSGLRSIKYNPALEVIYQFLSEGQRKIGLTPAAAAALQPVPNINSWPIMHIVFSNPTPLSDFVANSTAHSTILLVPEPTIKHDTTPKEEIYAVAKFTLLKDLILLEYQSPL